ncbi:MAG: DNA replication and repair protein RecF [Bacteroidetes bacterium]|nr:MAG: DNA replication and repair protein RecF [Bacteroidota bacterium]
MILNTLRLKDFRAHSESEIHFGERMNLVCGANGIGKTNVLESIHYLSLTKSFLTSTDQTLLSHEAPFFELLGEFTGEHRKQLKVRAAFVPGEGKKFFVNGSPVERKADHIGTIPTVLLCPQDYTLTAGGPGERRRFINNIISQSSSSYLDDLIRYRRTLKQRNEVLYRMKRSNLSGAEETLESWTIELVEIGSRIISARLNFCGVFSGLLTKAHEMLGDVVERPSFEYRPISDTISTTDLADIRDAFTAAIRKEKHRERQRGVTTVGPHRDEITFFLDDLEVRRFASQGQHRTFGMALKLAQFQYLRNETDETPIMLLDDVFDNLDRQRIQLFIGILQEQGMGQLIITAAQKEILEGFIDFESESNQMIELPLMPENNPIEMAVHAE